MVNPAAISVTIGKFPVLLNTPVAEAATSATPAPEREQYHEAPLNPHSSPLIPSGEPLCPYRQNRNNSFHRESP